MKGIDIFTSLSYVSSKYIEAISPNYVPQKRHSAAIKRVILVAACLVLLVSTVFALSYFINKSDEPIDGYDTISVYSESSTDDSSDISASMIESIDISDDTSSDEIVDTPPIYNNEEGDFTASEIADFFPDRMDAFTSAYQVLRFESLDSVMLGSLPNGEKLSALEFPNITSDYYEIEMGGTLEESIYIDGKTIFLNKNATYSEVYQSVLELLASLQKRFGIEYDDIIVCKRPSVDEYEVYIYDANDNKEFFVDGRPLFEGNHISLTIGSRVNPDEYISLNTLFYYGSSSKMKEIGSYKTISLKDAEFLLNQGYVFGGHICKRCMKNQSEVDFSNYDKVGIEYVPNPENNLVYPFYAFYKLIDDDRYARTYVPAFSVSGLDEYFESQTNIH